MVQIALNAIAQNAQSAIQNFTFQMANVFLARLVALLQDVIATE